MCALWHAGDLAVGRETDSSWNRRHSWNCRQQPHLQTETGRGVRWRLTKLHVSRPFTFLTAGAGIQETDVVKRPRILWRMQIIRRLIYLLLLSCGEKRWESKPSLVNDVMQCCENMWDKIFLKENMWDVLTLWERVEEDVLLNNVYKCPPNVYNSVSFMVKLTELYTFGAQ